MDTNNNTNNQNLPKRYIPATDTEFAQSVTRPSWSDRAQLSGIDQKVSTRYTLTNEDGTPVIDSKGKAVIVDESLLHLYEMFTQDIRLGNLTQEEVEFCRMHIDLAHDLMASGCKETALAVFERAIDVIETSHSRKGWFREKMGTVRTENKHEIHEPEKSLWTGKNKN